MKESKKMNTLLTILAKIVEDIAGRTNDAGQENPFWNISFRCATGRIFYAVLQSAEKSLAREQELREELAEMLIKDPHCEEFKSGRKADDQENAIAVSRAMVDFKNAFDQLHFDAVHGMEFDVDQYEATFPQNRKKSAKVDAKRLAGLMKIEDAA